MSEPLGKLSEALYQQLQTERFVLINTVDEKTGGPTASAISWIHAASPGKLRFAVDQQSKIVSNIRHNPKAVISFFGSGTVHAIYGEASVLVESMEGIPVQLTCIDLDIDFVKDVMFYGAKISVEPEYVKTYDKRAADKLDSQVFTALKRA